MPLDITYLGHSGFLLSDGSTTVAIDPFLTGNPVATMSAGDVKCDSIVVTHGHADHYSDVPAIAKANRATVYCAFEIMEHLASLGHEKCEPMNPGGKVRAPFGFVALTQAYHSSSFEGRYMGMPCGAVIGIGGKTVYHTGDTALFTDMRLIGEMYKPDIAMICVGDRFTMGPEAGARAAELVGVGVAIPIHYGTWPLLTSDIGAFRPAEVATRKMAPGERWSAG